MVSQSGVHSLTPVIVQNILSGVLVANDFDRVFKVNFVLKT